MSNTLTVMVGLPRSGKSTWIENNKGNSIVISHDWIREHILGITYAKSSNSVIWTISDSALRIVLGQGKDAILDGINNTKFVRKFYTDIAKEYGAEIKMVIIRAPLSVCLVRNKIASKHKLPDEDIIAMDKDFEWPSSEECGNIKYYDAVCKHELILEEIFHDSGCFIKGHCIKCKLDAIDCGFSSQDLYTMYRWKQIAGIDPKI